MKIILLLFIIKETIALVIEIDRKKSRIELGLREYNTNT